MADSGERETGNKGRQGWPLRLEFATLLTFPVPRSAFDSCAEHGTVSFDYDARIFAGQPV
jgi:hypothetical protein